MVIYKKKLCRIPKNLNKLPEKTGKNGAQRALIWKKWHPKSHEAFFFVEVIRKTVFMRKYPHKKWPKIFSGKFGEFGQKSFAPPKFVYSYTYALSYCEKWTLFVTKFLCRKTNGFG